METPPTAPSVPPVVLFAPLPPADTLVPPNPPLPASLVSVIERPAHATASATHQKLASLATESHEPATMP